MGSEWGREAHYYYQKVKKGCLQCGKLDHFKAQCLQLRRQGGNSNCYVHGQEASQSLSYGQSGKVNGRSVSSMLDTGGGGEAHAGEIRG